MIHNGKLFSKIESVSDGDGFVGCNLAQAEPGTPVFAGKKRLTFTGCNLARAVVPPDSVIYGGNTSQVALPGEIEPVEMVEIEASELAALLADREELKELKEASRG